MNGYRFFHHPLHVRLTDCALAMNREDHHLKVLIRDPNRIDNFSVKGGGLFFDYSRQRINATSLAMLLELADASSAQSRFADMARGEKVNLTENRAALHMATRRFSGDPVPVDGRNVMHELEGVREKIRCFSESVHREETTGSTGKAFRHVVVVGIGGSYLGTEFVATALEAFADKKMSLSFLANVDIHTSDISSRKSNRKKLYLS